MTVIEVMHGKHLESLPASIRSAPCSLGLQACMEVNTWVREPKQISRVPGPQPIQTECTQGLACVSVLRTLYTSHPECLAFWLQAAAISFVQQPPAPCCRAWS